MARCTLVFPHHLFASHPALHPGERVVLVEDPLFFSDARYPSRFHKRRLMLHRASMRRYADGLRDRGFGVTYIPWAEAETRRVCVRLASEGITTLTYADPVDFILALRLRREASSAGVRLEPVSSPLFLNTSADNDAYFGKRKRMFMADFYTHQRRRLGLLVDGDGNPAGGRWSFDEDNRKPLPKTLLGKTPVLPPVDEDAYVKEARVYVEATFPHHPGSTAGWMYPTSHAEAHAWLRHFLRHRLDRFGPYEDAFAPGEPFLYHSVLTPALNIGLITPAEVVEITLSEAGDAPLASLEGFLRQIVGWREFIRAAYERHGVAMRTTNHWNHTRPLPDAFYTGTTGLPPVDDAIRRALTFGYVHHIERLMVLGGLLFLLRIHPDAVYQWFMDLFVDAYDWVMVPNVYGMSQHADGGLITTKPYFSGSNYLRKMGRYPTGPWCDTWDDLFWSFLRDHKDTLAKNPRWAMLVRKLEIRN